MRSKGNAAETKDTLKLNATSDSISIPTMTTTSASTPAILGTVSENTTSCSTSAVTTKLTTPFLGSWADRLRKTCSSESSSQPQHFEKQVNFMCCKMHASIIVDCIDYISRQCVVCRRLNPNQKTQYYGLGALEWQRSIVLIGSCIPLLLIILFEWWRWAQAMPYVSFLRIW